MDEILQRLSTDAVFLQAAAACAAVAGLCWLLSVLTREYSWVDRLWSITPFCYVGFFAYKSGWEPRLVLMAALATAWGLRLTFNYARKGGYARGGEDYRWAILRERMSPALYQLFNVFFIAGYQHFLLFLLALPAYAAIGGAELGLLDAMATVSLLTLLAVETIADNQQWAFQEEKRRRREGGESVDEQFVQTGLFRYSRHPNFFAEQGIWWCMTLFAVSATGEWLHWSMLGAFLLTLLFQGSTTFTESITLKRYPEYAEYQRRTSRLIPLPPKTA